MLGLFSAQVAFNDDCFMIFYNYQCITVCLIIIFCTDIGR